MFWKIFGAKAEVSPSGNIVAFVAFCRVRREVFSDGLACVFPFQLLVGDLNARTVYIHGGRGVDNIHTYL